MQEISKKNYIIFGIIIIFVVVITLLLRVAYNNREQETSLIYNYLFEIKANELNSYLLENPSVIIYVSDKYDLDNEDMEKKLQDEINDLNVYNYFIYLDINDINEEFLNKFNERYNSSINLNQIPLMIVISDGKVINNYDNISNINLSDIVGDVK